MSPNIKNINIKLISFLEFIVLSLFWYYNIIIKTIIIIIFLHHLYHRIRNGLSDGYNWSSRIINKFGIEFTICSYFKFKFLYIFKCLIKTLKKYYSVYDKIKRVMIMINNHNLNNYPKDIIGNNHINNNKGHLNLEILIQIKLWIKV